MKQNRRPGYWKEMYARRRLSPAFLEKERARKREYKARVRLDRSHAKTRTISQALLHWGSLRPPQCED